MLNRKGSLFIVHQFAGLYTVEKYWKCVGKSGFKVFKFALRRCPNQPPPPWVKQNKTEGKEESNKGEEKQEEEKENREDSASSSASNE